MIRRIKVFIVCAFTVLSIAANIYVHSECYFRHATEHKNIVLALFSELGNTFAKTTDNLGFTGHNCSTKGKYNLEEIALPKSKENLRILKRKGFSNGWSQKYKCPLWTSYRIFPVPPESELGKRPAEFHVDPELYAVSPSVAQYRARGYDRGHMAPNRAIALLYGPEAQRETFALSNICFQRPLLNQGTWGRMERQLLESFAPVYGEVLVFIGPIIGKDKTDAGVAIPEAFWQIAVTKNRRGKLVAMGMVVPQNTTATEPLRKFLCSIREIEDATNIDFFSNLTQSEQDLLEKPRSTRQLPCAWWFSARRKNFSK